MPLFEVVVMEMPERAKFEGDGFKPERLVLGPKAVVAQDSQGAAIAAVMDAGAELKVDRARMQVIVRPFE